MTTPTKTDLLDRVRALLAKAEGTDSKHEAEALTAKATELMAKYGIDAAMAAARADVRQKPANKVVLIENPYANRKSQLYYGLLKAFGCDAVWVASGSNTKLHVFGFEADLEAVEMLYTSLLLQAAHQSQNVPSWENARSWRTEFWAGFSSIVVRRVRQSRRTVEDAETKKEPGTAIVLRDRAVEVRDALKAEFPHVRTVRRATHVSTSGYGAGQRAGRNANIHDRAATGAGSHRALH